MSDGRLEGKVAVVTGAARGLGEAIARELAGEGARVAVLDLDERAGTATAASLPGGLFYRCDVSRSVEVEEVFAEIARSMGGPDVLVNNAGLSIVGQATHELPDEVWERTVAVMQSGVFYCSRAAGRTMVSRGEGAIVNIASIRGFAPKPGRLAYCAAKAAVLMMTRVMAADWAAHGVRVNAIAPGFQRTKMLDDEVAAGRIDLSQALATIPMGRLGEPREIGRLCVFLASDEATYVTGACIVCDGALTAVPAA